MHSLYITTYIYVYIIRNMYDNNFLHAHKNMKQVCLLTHYYTIENTILIRKLPYIYIYTRVNIILRRNELIS